MTDFERGYAQGRGAALMDHQPLKTVLRELLAEVRKLPDSKDPFREQAESVFTISAATIITKYMVPDKEIRV